MAEDRLPQGAPASGLARGLERLIKWDSVHYLRVARCGYEYEHQAAFLPLFPTVVANAAAPLVPVLGGDAAAALAGTVLNTALFAAAAVALLRLARATGLDRTASRRAVLLFVTNPASPFFSAPLYTESAYAAAFFAASAAVAEGRWALAAFAVALASSVRANGAASGAILVGGAFAVDAVLPWLVRARAVPTSLVRVVPPRQRPDEVSRSFARAVALVACAAFPLVANERASFLRFCPSSGAPAWCASPLPLPYTHAQAEYWNVGPFRYWTLAQLPNFLLAAPAWYVSALALVAISRRRDARLLPHALVLAFSAVLSLVVMHVQVSTRFLAAGCPALYLGLSVVWPRLALPARRLLLAYHLVYFSVGAAAHNAHLPWT